MDNIFETYLSNHPVEPEANPVTTIKSMAYYIEAVELEKTGLEETLADVEAEIATADAEISEKSSALDSIKAILKVETDADILKEVERLKALDI